MSFDRDAAVRDWRTSILSRGGLTVSEVDELQDHLEHIEMVLLEDLRPEEAFWLAAHRVGTPDALTREFSKVRPNMSWAVRAQWALLGLVGYMLLVPVARALLYLLAAGLSQSRALLGVAALVRLYAPLLAILVVISGLAFLVRRLGVSPTVFDRVMWALGSSVWLGRAVIAVGVLVWQVAVAHLYRLGASLAAKVVAAPGEPALIQSGFWYGLNTALDFVLPMLLLVEVIAIQRRLNGSRLRQY